MHLEACLVCPDTSYNFRGGVLTMHEAEIYYFKPQTVLVSTMFLAIISYVLGLAMETFIPTAGWFRYLNPGPFNKKENAMIGERVHFIRLINALSHLKIKADLRCSYHGQCSS